MGFCNRKGVECECLTDHSVCDSNNCHRNLPDVNNLEDKENQIEEMAQYLKGYLFPLDNNSIENCRILASALISQGWLKLPKDNVVLSADEFANLKAYAYKKGSKETSEKFIAKIKQFLSNVETVRGDDRYSLYPEIGYKCSEVDNFIDDLSNNSMLR